MAEEHTTADDHATAGAEAPMAERVEILEEAAEGIADLQSQALDPAELSRQLEDLTSVVLNSAEVSTRSASVAADVSADMQSVMDKIAESHKRSVHHPKLILGAFLVFIIRMLFGGLAGAIDPGYAALNGQQIYAEIRDTDGAGRTFSIVGPRVSLEIRLDTTPTARLASVT